MNQKPQLLTILGATGSIGASTLDVVARHPDRYRIFALTAQSSYEPLLEQVRQFKPRYAVLRETDAAEQLRQALTAAGMGGTEVLAGEEGLATVAAHPDVDTVMAAIVGAAGLAPTLAAVRAGKKVLLANKEALVMAGRVFMDAVRDSGAQLLPIDSEHNAIFQCLPSDYAGDAAAKGVRRVLLTASGGPFRETPLAELERVTPVQACAHPNWSMGRKISVDSATMMNKGLELVEACWLFNLDPAQVQIVIHPQSIIHSLVDYVDGSVLAQLGNPDMRTPIANALAWPQRIDSGVGALDLIATARLDFAAPDPQRFPCLGLVQQALKAGGSAVISLNAANEVAVAAFLEGHIAFTDIAEVIATVMQRAPAAEPDTLDRVQQADLAARQLAEEDVGRRRQGRVSGSY